MLLSDAIVFMLATLGGSFTLLILVLITRADKLVINWNLAQSRLSNVIGSLFAMLIYPMVTTTQIARLVEWFGSEFAAIPVLSVFGLIAVWYAWALIRFVSASLYSVEDYTASTRVRRRLEALRENKHR